MKEYLPACRLVATHGVHGELKALPLCDGIAFLASLKRLYPSQEGGEPLLLRAVRGQRDRAILCFAGIDDIDKARSLVGRTFYFAKRDVQLPQDRYFIDDVLGCSVVDANSGVIYGTVSDVDHPAAQDIYTVTDEKGATYRFPAVPAFVQEIDIQNRKVTVTPIPGMFSASDAEE